jgi:LacI family transcriptional regulator
LTCTFESRHEPDDALYAALFSVVGLVLMKIRMKDIARDLGLSVVTISKVLRGHPDISEATRDRVLQRIKELNYSPNLSARSLVTGRSYMIGLVVPDLLHPFFAEIAKSLSRQIRDSGYYLLIASSDGDQGLEENEVEQLLARGLDALVIASCQHKSDLFLRLRERQITLVLLDREFAGVSANFVGVDDEAVGAMAAQHLIDVGCRRVAHIRGPRNSVGDGRLRGFERVIVANGLKLASKYIVAGSSRELETESHKQGAERMLELLRGKPCPDGVFCYSDPTAMGAMDAILEEGLSVPGDIAVIGCGNLHYDGSLRVPLSSIDQRSSAIGERVGKMVLSLLSRPEQSRPKRVLVECSLVARASTARRLKKKSAPQI